MPQIGRLLSVGIGKETTWGTAVSPTHFIPVNDDFDYDDKQSQAVRDGRMGIIESSHGSDVVQKWGEGVVGGNIYNNSFGMILLAAFGSVSSATHSGESTVYDHEFEMDSDSNSHPSFTLSVNDAEAGDKQYAGLVLNTLEVVAELEQYAMFTAEFMGKSEASGSISPSFSSSEKMFRPQDMTFKIAADESGLAGASAISIRSLTLKLEKNAEAWFGLGSVNPSRVYNKHFSGTIDIEMLYADDTYRDLWMAGTQKAILVKLVNANETLGLGTNPELTFTINAAEITDWSVERSQDDIQVQTMTWRIDYSLTDSKALSALLTNSTASY